MPADRTAMPGWHTSPAWEKAHFIDDPRGWFARCGASTLHSTSRRSKRVERIDDADLTLAVRCGTCARSLAAATKETDHG